MKILAPEQISEYEEFLRSHENFIVTGHKDPDGDCVSSMLVASEILKFLKKDFILVNQGPFKRAEIRQYEELFSNSLPFISKEDKASTALIIVDCSELSRLGDIGEELKGFDTFIVDHHKTSEGCELENGAQSIIDSSSPAAVCLMQMLYEGIVGAPDERVAKIMFFGLSTDTGYFRFLHQNSAEVFELAARLVRAGADPGKTYEDISGGKPWATRKLLGTLLSHAELYCGGKLALTYETMEDTKLYGQEGRDSDMLYSALLGADGVEAAVFLRQETSASCTGGFRSRGEIDVSAVAAKFGGGGHKNASGMNVDGKLDTLIPQIVKEFSKIFSS
ncbi:MAG: bifunctional oligoribonuclease/PAP phosphatase NrnA [Treponema sp.]|nr:bifunctional oligoribonuclease/PAP phosphatase NrnA [Treponema sp.]